MRPWSFDVFSGYGDVTPSTTPEVLFTIVYVAINIVVWAYILGTITLLVTKQVLAVYPTTIRRRILRQLYSAPLKECYLFQHCGVKFLDALMLGARVELFLPKVEIVSSLDHVNELYIVVGGHVELVTPKTFKEQDRQRLATDDSNGELMSSPKQPYRAQLALPSTGGSSSNGDGGGGGSGWVSRKGASHPAALKTMTGRVVSWFNRQRNDSWRKEQEQLHQDRAALAAVSASQGKGGTQDGGGGGDFGPHAAQPEAAGVDSVGPLYAAASAGVNAWQPQGHMPAAAVKRLDKMSKMPMSMVAHVMSDASPSPGQAVAMEGDISTNNPILGPSDCFAEVAYFTEVPKAEAVQSLTVCRVLVIPRSTYNSVARDFPLSARQVLENLKTRAAELVAQFLPEDIARELLQQADRLTPSGMSAQRAETTAEDDFYDAVHTPLSVDLSAVFMYGYSPSLASSSCGTSVDGSSAAAAAGEGSRQAKALHRFTSTAGASKQKEMATMSADAAEAAAKDAAVKAARRSISSSGGAAGEEDQMPLSPGVAGAGRFKAAGERVLTTMSLVPYSRNEDVARALEGMSVTSGRRQRQQQQQQQMRRGGSLDIKAPRLEQLLGSISSGRGEKPSLPAPAEDVDQTYSEQQQQQPSPFLPMSQESVRGSKAASRVGKALSDEQVQAAAAATGQLTLQQQRLLADLLRLRQLVNKAAAKFDQQRLTAFLDAAAHGEVEVVQSMLRQGMSPDSADYDGRTALMLAAYKGHKDVVLALLFVGADPSLKDAQGFDAMIEAARGASREVIGVLSRSGAKTGISRVLQASLLCKATYEGKLDRLRCLLLSGCAVVATDYDGQTALHVAAADGNLPAARVLVKAGADVTLKDRWGYSPLDLAHKVGAAPLVEFFESVVSPEAAAAAAEAWKRERTEAALAAARYGDCAALQRLLERGCPVDAADYDGRTLLHVAVTNGQEGAVKVLLAAGANPNATNSAGSSPLLEAAMNGSREILATLMAAGAKLNLPTTEEAALLSSVIHLRRHDQLLNLLIAGADPAAADYDSRTPLHIAASIGDVEALQLLAAAVEDSSIERLTAVNWQARDRWGDTPLQEAARAGHDDAAAFLQEMMQQQADGMSLASAPAASAAMRVLNPSAARGAQLTSLTSFKPKTASTTRVLHRMRPLA
eukprot:gene3994-4245_t